jgi:TetR/AcrR family transcriptional regulator, regulator of mycofactocin system
VFPASTIALSAAAARTSAAPVLKATLAACRAAYDRWSARADDDLTIYLDAALTALAAGFAPEAIKRPIASSG